MEKLRVGEGGSSSSSAPGEKMSESRKKELRRLSSKRRSSKQSKIIDFLRLKQTRYFLSRGFQTESPLIVSIDGALMKPIKVSFVYRFSSFPWLGHRKVADYTLQFWLISLCDARPVWCIQWKKSSFWPENFQLLVKIHIGSKPLSYSHTVSPFIIFFSYSDLLKLITV